MVLLEPSLGSTHGRRKHGELIWQDMESTGSITPAKVEAPSGFSHPALSSASVSPLG